MNTGIKVEKYIFAFVVAGLIALIGFGSGEIAFGIVGLVAISILAGRLATKLAGG